jgi:pentose-5-phosphate-3-epimerase
MKGNDALLERLSTVSNLALKPNYVLRRTGKQEKPERVKSSEAIYEKKITFCSPCHFSSSLHAQKNVKSLRSVGKKIGLWPKVNGFQKCDEFFLAQDFVKVLKLTPCKNVKSFKDSFRCRLRREGKVTRSSLTNTIEIQTSGLEDEGRQMM